jgi:PAS domain S-box-containing protein
MKASPTKVPKSPVNLNSAESAIPGTAGGKPLAARRRTVNESMFVAVIFIATIYWFLDSILNIFFSNKFNLIAELFGPDLYDIYLRAVVLCLFIIFGSHAQTIINRLKDAKRQLDESEQLWRSLVATAPDMITLVDQNGIIRFINQSIGTFSAQRAAGQNFYHLLPRQYQDLARKSIQSVFQTGQTESFEVQVDDRRNPTWFTYRIGALKVAGKVIAATIISSNTTEFKRAEELIRYKELFDNVAEGVFLFSPSGNLIESNERVLECTGYTKKEFLRLNFAKIVSSEQIALVEAMLKKVRQEKEMRFELNLMAKDGRLIPNEINCRYVSYLGEPCFLCVARDITKTKLLQNQLIRSERLAATGQLAASIAHEINSPLQGITALLSVLRMNHQQDMDLLKKLDLIKNAFGSIRDTVRNLIDLNRPGKEKKQTIVVNQVIENTVALVRSHLKKSKVNIKLGLTAAESTINASPQQIGQVIMNLINNAVEAITGSPDFEQKLMQTPLIGGEIYIESCNRNDEIVITVKDTGPGIAANDLEHIFDPFFTRKKTMGMGVGLSICHGIVEDHKGVITADNSLEGGAVFTIRLPLKDS